MEFKKIHWIGIGIALVAILANFLLFFNKTNMNLFYFFDGIIIIIALFPFVFSLMIESNKEKENNEMFLEFARNLVESVKSGTPISKSILNLKDKYYGSLTVYIQKLANQIALGIPVKDALEIFARDVNSSVITRAVTLISQAEKAGGEIEGILESVSKSVSEIEKLKKERQSAVYGLVVQGYMIFFIFIAIMLIMQFKILPMTQNTLQDQGSLEDLSGIGFIGGGSSSPTEVSQPMLYLLLVQGFFTGMVVGKLAEGNFKAGVKHSFIMVGISLLIYLGAKAFLG